VYTLVAMIPTGESGIVEAMAIMVTGVSEKPADGLVRVVSGGVVIRRELFDRLSRAGRVTEVSGPAGSGKSVLLQSWIDEAAPAGHTARVSVDEDGDPQRFWASVADALRATAPGSALIRPFTAAPELDGWSVVAQLLADLSPLRDRIWLVIDDVHALSCAETLRQLELLVMRAPAGLRFVLASRPELRLGLHRLRLEGELTEIRAASLRFSRDEARALFEAAGVRLSESALALLHERTEGWAAGLRLAALSLAGHPDPERFAAEFCGRERTVAEYLLAAAAELMRGSLEEGARYLALAAAEAAAVPTGRRDHFRVTLAVLRLYLARQRGDRRAVAEEVEQLRSDDALDMAQLGLSEELRALALISLGIAELWSLRVREAEAHLEQGVALARRIERPLLEINGLAHWGVAASFRSSALAVERGRQAIELARQHGWSGEPLVAIAYPMLAGSLIWQGELDEAERWLAEGEQAIQSEADPATELFQLVRGCLEIARSRVETALAALRTAGRLPLAAHPLTMELRAFLLHALVRLGKIASADAALTETAEEERDRPGMRTAVAALRLAQHNPRAATAALAPLLDGSAAGSHQGWLITAFLLEASAQDARGEREAAGRALERALDLAESDGLLFPFLLHPVPELLERHARQRTAHPALIWKIINALSGRTPAAPVAGPAEHLPDPLSQAEARVLRFLQTSLSAPEIARELYVSVNTVRTHMRHVYDKLGAHRRLEAVDRARALGLLAPVPQRAAPSYPDHVRRVPALA
jgi:DNA-binding CsgD family transcriptional regulator/type II secretory pathway predicted ATPase ExeA